VSPRGPRHRIGVGVYKDAIGLSATVKVNGRQRERRFKADTAPETIATWQRRMRAKIELGQDAPAPAERTLAEDIDAYLTRLPDTGTTLRNATTDLGAWSALYGAEARAALTSQVIDAQLAAWRKAGVAASTCNHRRQALSSLWQALDGRSAPNPVKDVPKRPEPRSAPRGLPWPVLRRILGRVKGKTRARLFVLAHTGWPHAVLARLEPRDCHLSATPPHVIIRSRQKGAGVAGRALPISPQAARALTRLAAAKAWGEFSRHSMHAAFKRAAAKAKASWDRAAARRAKRRGIAPPPWPAPPNVHPYDLRRSLLTDVYRATGDLQAVAEIGLHASLSTTMKYIGAAVNERARLALAAATTARRGAGTPAGTTRKRENQR
jgi:integrase